MKLKAIEDLKRFWRVVKPRKKIWNTYSNVLFLTLASLLVGGATIILVSVITLPWYWFVPVSIFGIILMMLGGYMFRGFKTLSPADPREKALITVFGNRTETVVEGQVLLLDYLPFEIIGITKPFDMRIVDKEFIIDSIRTVGGPRMKGKVSISLEPIEEGDEDIGGKTEGEHLQNFDDAGRMEAIMQIIKDMLPSAIQEIAKLPRPDNGKERDYQWMESNPERLQAELFQELQILAVSPARKWIAPVQRTIPPVIPPSRPGIAQLSGLGVRVKKLTIQLTPINQKLVTADEDVEVERRARKGQVEDTKTMNQRTAERQDFYQERAKTHPDEKVPTAKQCRDEVLAEIALKEGVAKFVFGSPTINLEGGEVTPVKGGGK